MGAQLHRLGRLASTRPWIVLATWVAGSAGAVLLVGFYGANTSDDLRLPGSDSQAATDLLAARFPPQQNGASPVVFHATTGKVTDAPRQEAIEAARAAIVQLPHVYSATDPFSTKGQAQLSADDETAFVPVLLDVGSSELTEEIARSVLDAAEPARAAGLQVAVGGPVGEELSEPSTETSELVGIVAAMVILTLAFGTIVAMGMPIATAVIGLVVGLSFIGLLSYVATVPSIAPTLATMIGLGVGIDYALFLVARHRRQLRTGMAVVESISLAVATSGSAIVFAGGTVIIALLALTVVGIPLVTSLGYAAAIAVATAVLAALTLLPALLGLLGGRLESVALPAFLRSREKPPGAGFWAGWARFVTDRPWLTALAALVLLLPLLVPVRALVLGQEDVGATPESTTQRQAYDLMTTGFGVGYNGPLLVAVELDTPAAPSAELTSQLEQAKALQEELEQEQTDGNAQKSELTRQADALAAQQADLERQEAELEQQQADLQAQSTQLEAQRAALASQATALEERAVAVRAEQRALLLERRRLEDEALRLARRGATPAELRALREQQRSLRRRQAALRADEKALADESVALAREAAQLAAQSAALVQESEDLQQQAAELNVAAANLQTEAAQLQTQQAQLEGLQQQATTNQQQAEELQREITAELTAAGGDQRGTDPRLVALQDGLAATPDVALVSPPQINAGGNAATFSVIATTAPASTETADLVRTVRAFTIPQATAGTDVQAHVGGSTAANVDLAAAIGARLPIVIAIVILLSFAVLLAAYRSLIVPTQAALANVLCVTAAFGVLTAVFQWGWGIEALGIDTARDTVPIASYVPLMMFAVLFGLSMDYQVFLLSQIEHHRAAGLDARAATAAGVAGGAPMIVSAALIMMAVFGSFVLNGDPTVKQFGVGLSVGVGLAATMVLTFAPAILVLVGRASWWLPRGLDHFLPNLDLEGEARAER